MRNFLPVFLLALLAACATVPAKPGFTKQQVAALTEQGFEPVGENYELDFNDRVLFDVDKSDLTQQAQGVLSRLTATLLKVEIHGASVIGHTDSTGSSEYNLALSQRRAASVKMAMASAGMESARIRDQGMGESQPIADNDTEVGRAQNRRVVIIVTPADAD